MHTRRALLKRSALISLAPIIPCFLDRTLRAAGTDRDGRLLVVVQLDGGNDGINTVVPYSDAEYATLRRELRLREDRLFKLNDHVGLHPAMRPAAKLVEDGRMAIVQGVGYPNPDRSHFRSMAIWQTARLEKERQGGDGWLGWPLATANTSVTGPSSVFVGEGDLPQALRGRRSVTVSFADAADLALAVPIPPDLTKAPSGDDLVSFVNRTVTTAYATAAELTAAAKRSTDSTTRYPDSKLAKQLELISRSIKAGSAARVYYVIQAGYDTHAVQLPTQARLLGEFSGAIQAFLDDLAAAQLADRVLLMAFSEFGRRPAENGSLGTDHGTAGPLFLAGRGLKAGLIGATPRLGELVDGDLKWSIDFRRVYATLLDQWLMLPSQTILGQRFEPLAILNG